MPIIVVGSGIARILDFVWLGVSRWNVYSCWSILVEYFFFSLLYADHNKLILLQFPHKHSILCAQFVFVIKENYPTQVKKSRIGKHLLIKLQRWTKFRNTWWDEDYMRVKIIRKRHGYPSWRVGSTLLLVLTWVLCDLCDHGQTAKRRKWNKVTWWKMRNSWPVFKADI